MAKHELRTPEGAPVQVETGIGTIANVEWSEGKRNALVKIDAAHLRQPVTGWVDTQGPMWPRVQWAQTNGAKVWYRVDLKRHRNAKAPIATPLGELDRMEKTRDLVRIERPESAPADSTIGLDPLADRADGSGAAASVSAPAVTATDGHAPQGPPAPAAAATPPTQQQPVTPSPAVSAPGPHAGTPANPSPRPQTAPPVPGPALGAQAVDALHDVVQAVQARADDAWVGSCCDDALAAGATRDQVLHVLDRARRGLDVGLPAREGAPALPVERSALDRVRDPDHVAQRAPAPPQGRPGAHEGQPSRRPQMGARSGHTRAAQPIAGDERPWTPFNTDGRPNLSSYGFGAVMEMTTLALKLRVNRTRARHAEDPSVPLEPPSDAELHELAATLLYLADRTQFEARADGQVVGRVDRMAASHKVARQAVREGIDLFPLPWGQDAEDWTSWRDLVVRTAVSLLGIATGLYVGVEREQGGAPQVDVPPADPGSR